MVINIINVCRHGISNGDQYRYSPNLLFGSLQNISAPVGIIEKLMPLYNVHRPFRF